MKVPHVGWNGLDDVKLDITRKVKERFDAEGISFPFPQREVRILSDHDSGSLAVSRNAAKID